MSLDVAAAPTARRPRRRAPLLVVLLGGGALLAGLALTIFLVLDASAYRHWPADAAVVEGQPGRDVRVEPGERFLLWKSAGSADPRCTAVALPSGTPVPLKAASTGERGGGAVAWVGFAEGRTDSSRISVSCAATARTAYDEPATVRVDQLDGLALLDGLGPRWPVAAALLVAGIALPVTGIVLARRR